MAKEQGVIGDPRAIDLPVQGFDAFCKQLLAEGINYDRLPPEQVEVVGTNTSILLHEYTQRAGRWISLHFRENLEPLAEVKTPVARAKAFLTNLGEDLHLLAGRLTGELSDVHMIYGLTQLSASWGRRHGFTTVQFTPDPEVTRNHRQSITDRPPQINDQTPLTLFLFEREPFVKRFLRENPNTPEVSIPGVAGN
ncbi:MAG: hypothetical protein UT84_C0003G0026 [Candidatus Curtissbacteria bacterium GW2011_GWA1_40_16]|uniref:Uncharacterized protein n=1 Tax=Candidatus Curtissbacteria bacterium GW2011_GWA1_40_16 TaxID=1618405 RepID=A0A0G0RM98_9BACT|nr:MAG: hypothetical protein UT84_C0003G0026 [Candidatus Curtissbacteria bacterium GW2011_GWA1_40_16]